MARTIARNLRIAEYVLSSATMISRLLDLLLQVLQRNSVQDIGSAVTLTTANPIYLLLAFVLLKVVGMQQHI